MSDVVLLLVIILGIISIVIMYISSREPITIDVTDLTKSMNRILSTLEAQNTNLYRIWDDGVFIRTHRALISENRKTVMQGKDIPNTYTIETDLNDQILEQVNAPFIPDLPDLKESSNSMVDKIMYDIKKDSRKVQPIILTSGAFDDNGFSLVPQVMQRIDDYDLLLEEEEFKTYVESNLHQFSVENRDAVERWFDLSSQWFFENEEERKNSRAFFFKGYYAYSDQLLKDVMGGTDENEPVFI